jgi:hypothetical protein
MIFWDLPFFFVHAWASTEPAQKRVVASTRIDRNGSIFVLLKPRVEEGVQEMGLKKLFLFDPPFDEKGQFHIFQGRRIAKSVAIAIAIDCNRQLQSADWKGCARFALAIAIAIEPALDSP